MAAYCSGPHPLRHSVFHTCKQRRAWIERGGPLQPSLRGCRLAELRLEPGRDQPEPPVLLVSADCHIDPGPRSTEIAAALVDERQLRVRRRCPRLETTGIEGAGECHVGVPCYSRALTLFDREVTEERRRLCQNGEHGDQDHGAA